MPGGNDRFAAEVTDVNFFGEGRFRSIAYVLNPEGLQEQWQYLTTKLDQLNRVTGYCGEFDLHVAFATIPQEHIQDGDRVLDAFWSFAPDTLTLLPASAQAS